MIGVITINYNLSAETIPCVESVLASSYKQLKIYLIDNGSEKKDFQQLIENFSDNPKVHLLRIEKNCGYVGGVNVGLKAAMKSNPDYFMVMNNDTIIDSEAIAFLVESAITNKNEAIISGKVYYYNQPDVLQHTGEVITDFRYIRAIPPGRNQKDVGQFDQEVERDILDDVFWIIPKQVFKAVGFYCDYFYLYAEQADYALRARKKGYKLIFTPKAKVWHKESLTTGGGNNTALTIHYWRGQGLFIFQNRHLKPKYFTIQMITSIAKHIAKVIFGKAEKRAASFAFLRGYFWGFRWMFNKRPNTGDNPYLK